MSVSVFELFSIGIGPSSSHTVGPMRAAKQFSLSLEPVLPRVCRISVTLHGSLAWTGRGHGTDKALLLGLEGFDPETVEPEWMVVRFKEILTQGKLQLGLSRVIDFEYYTDVSFCTEVAMPHHPNGMVFTAYDQAGIVIKTRACYSVGGGFIIDHQSMDSPPSLIDGQESLSLPYTFSSAHELLALCEHHQLSIAELVFANEAVARDESEIERQLLRIASVMFECIDAGCQQSGVLPGGLGVKRRAATLYQKLLKQGKPGVDHQQAMNWMNVYALAVNEQNAAGGRVVTAPTNGAAGIIPAVMRYHQEFVQGANEQHLIDFLLTAGAIGSLYKQNASISGAEMGCQGEVGVACSMAAGALAAVLGGTIYQVEHASEIAMEHNLGLTCDPVGGLVQIPCIERNAMGTVKAINAANLALSEDGEHLVSLDDVIKTMYEVGCNMHSMYKETSQGGLATAVNLIEC